MAKFYILLSQSGTLPSRVLKIFTRAKYNHVSISLASDLKEMYSFGRRYLHFPFPGGFVSESRERGVFGRYPHAEIAVLEVEVAEDKYECLASRLKEMYADKKTYHYNILGVGLAAIHIVYRKKHCYYCSEFVRDILVECGIADAAFFRPIVQPVHFLGMADSRVIFQGKLSNYFA